MSCVQNISSAGTSPINLQWKIVRGNTSRIRIDFLENDESTGWDTTGWTYTCTVYDNINDSIYELIVDDHSGYVEIIAPAFITSELGRQYGEIVGEIPFDLQVQIADGDLNPTWTPISGTICLIGEVTTGSTL